MKLLSQRLKHMFRYVYGNQPDDTIRRDNLPDLLTWFITKNPAIIGRIISPQLTKLLIAIIVHDFPIRQTASQPHSSEYH